MAASIESCQRLVTVYAKPRSEATHWKLIQSRQTSEAMAANRLLRVTGCTLPLALFGLLGCAQPNATPNTTPAGLRSSFDSHSNVSEMALSPDGRTLAVGSDTDPVYLWDLEMGKELFRLAKTVKVKVLVFSPDGRTLTTVLGQADDP